MKPYFIAPELIAELERAFPTPTINDLQKSETERFRLVGQHDVVEWLKLKAKKVNGDSQ